MGTLRMIVWLSLSLMSTGLWAQRTNPANNPKANLVAGLKGDYFEGTNFERKVMTRTDPQVDFNWNWQSPGSGVPREYFSVRWTGKLYAPTTGKYRFSATADDGVRVWVNGKKIIDEWRKQDDSNFVGEVSLNGHQLYDLRIEYYNDWKGSVISVFWESPEDQRLFSFTSTPRQTIPAKYLFSKPDRPALATKRTPVSIPAMFVGGNRPANPFTTPIPTPIQPAVVQTKHQINPIAKVSRQPKPMLATVVPEVSRRNPVASADQPFADLIPGKAIVFQRVVFQQSEYVLLPESYTELDKLVQALRTTPALQIEIAGHTDNVGDKRLNLTLSEFRAKVVANYLIRHGIADTRVTAKGYGGSRPITDNASETQRAQNRRVEFIVNP